MKNKIYFFILLPAFSLLAGIPAFAVKHTIVVGNYFFNPSTLQVTVGDTVHWQWSAGTHTTTSGVIPAGAAAWDAPVTNSSQFFDYKVTMAGTYNYVCTPHVAMGMIASFTAAELVPSLAVAPPDRNVPSDAGSTTFDVTSNTAWTAESNVSWCTITPAGTGNGTIVAGYETNATHSGRVATITVTVTGLPVQTVTVTQDGSTLGIGESAGADISVYPNPTKGAVTISSGSTMTSGMRITISDLNGRQVFETTTAGRILSVKLSSLSKGYYFIKVEANGASVVRRLMLTD